MVAEIAKNYGAGEISLEEMARLSRANMQTRPLLAFALELTRKDISSLPGDSSSGVNPPVSPG